jgi:SMODS domain-containing protein
MVALDYPTYKDRYDDDSAAMLRWLRDRLDAEYSNTAVSTKQVAIRMALGDGLQVDLVPTFPRKGGGYLMPNGSGGWRSTNPPFHAAAMSRANADLNLKLKPLVRVMKAWNDANGHHLQSFHVEMMVWEMWHNDKVLPALPQAVSDTLRKGVTWMKYPMNDPWTDAGTRAIDAYLSTEERGVVSRLFDADHGRAEQAIAYDLAGKTEEAFERWGVVFVSRFPGYG